MWLSRLCHKPADCGYLVTGCALQPMLHLLAPDIDLVLCIFEVNAIRNVSTAAEPITINPNTSLPAYPLAGLAIPSAVRANTSTFPITLCAPVQLARPAVHKAASVM